MIEIQPATEPVEAVTHLPGSKSYTNRALLVAALAEGRSVLRGALFSDDTERMIEALGELGYEVAADRHAETLTVTGTGGAVPSSEATLMCGNAGTAVRFLIALCALGRGRYTVDGNERMRQRPQGPLIDALNALGVKVWSRHGNGCPPVIIETEGCRGGAVAVDGSVSSQYFSALAMAAPGMADGLTVEVTGELVSKPYLDITAGVMAAFGVSLSNDGYRRFSVAPGQRYQATDYTIEPDASTASYFFAMAAVTGGRVTVAGLSRRSAQGDVGFVDVLARMGCRVDDGPEGLTVTGPERLRGVDVDMNAISDTAMTLAAIAPFAETPTRVRNIAHARAQESDRVAVMATELSRLGVPVTEHPDGWTIQPAQPHGGAVETYDDHRIAMSFAVLGLRTPGVVVRGAECVSKTFPSFFAHLGALTAQGLV